MCEQTAVMFRKWHGEIIALFPELPGNTRPDTCSSYIHIGQHGAADLHGMIRDSEPASPEDYASLKRELESKPYEYKLKVIRRNSYQNDQKRFDALHAF